MPVLKIALCGFIAQAMFQFHSEFEIRFSQNVFFSNKVLTLLPWVVFRMLE